MPQELIGAAFGLGFPFLMTTAGAATVFCLRREASAGCSGACSDSRRG